MILGNSRAGTTIDAKYLSLNSKYEIPNIPLDGSTVFELLNFKEFLKILEDQFTCN